MLKDQTKHLQHTFSLLSTLTFFIFMGASPVFAQDKSQKKAVVSQSIQEEISDEIIDTPSNPATYPGGLRTFNKDFIRHFKLSRPVFTDTRVVLMFIVEEDGSLSDMRVIQNPGLDISKAALAALAKTKNWVPAQHNGELVRSQFTVPITIVGSGKINHSNQINQTNPTDLTKPAI
ncbi:energy transducer TonB [Myroides odoratus]|uniref:energy transducer TonB n=1 Tax=Myroides odoratus TaxID=256 RepID=UPI000765F472|nr:energy transducer TonB [Myroides odoratus]